MPGNIAQWRSIVTLLVFLITNVVVVFPFSCPVPTYAVRSTREVLVRTRILPLRRDLVCERDRTRLEDHDDPDSLRIPFNFVTMPFFAVLFLLAIQAIGGTEIKHGIIGDNNIHPIDIMAFFLALAYMAISIDTTGLIRFSAWWVLQKAGNVGHRLYFLLYVFFFSLGSFVGNDPIILSGTAFLAYLTRVAANIEHPRAWIFAQFSVANVASAILVSSNPTNLVLAGAFQIKFFLYTANMIIPVLFTAAALFPFLLYIVFPSEELIPLEIHINELPTAHSDETIVATPPPPPPPPRPNKPLTQQDRWKLDRELQKQLPLEDLLNPYIEVRGALFGGVLFAITLGTLLAVNATGHSPGVYAVTVPAAFVQLCRDVYYDLRTNGATKNPDVKARRAKSAKRDSLRNEKARTTALSSSPPQPSSAPMRPAHESTDTRDPEQGSDAIGLQTPSVGSRSTEKDVEQYPPSRTAAQQYSRRVTAYGLLRSVAEYADHRIPTVYTVVQHLPFALIPFAFCMFIIVEGLVDKGWVELFAKGWAAWANEVGVVGCIAGMGFVSVVLCNFAGTNIGATILLSRVLQAWLTMHTPSDRVRDATIYALALGVNYGAFSATFSASLAGLLWRDILARKCIRVRRLDFARINVPIIAICMAMGCGILAGQVYIIKDGKLPQCTASHGHPNTNGTCR